MVLTPRRWRQVGGDNSAGDGGKQARSPGRARRKPLKPLRGECWAPSVTVVTNSRVFYTTREAAGAPGARHSLLPLISRDKVPAQLGRIAPREREAVFEIGKAVFEIVWLFEIRIDARRHCRERSDPGPYPEERRRSLSSGRASRGPVGRVSKDEDALWPNGSRRCTGQRKCAAGRAPHHHEGSAASCLGQPRWLTTCHRATENACALAAMSLKFKAHSR